jgi:DNA-directed RNA polymerase subunit omega
MARVTVEDCVSEVTNRFELVVLAAERAKKINSGAAITVARDNDKDAVIALREIASNNLDIEGLRASLLKRLQKRHAIEEIEDDEESLLSAIEETFEYTDGSEFGMDDAEESSSVEVFEDMDDQI